MKIKNLLATITAVAFFATVFYLNTCFRFCSDDCFYGSLWTEPFKHLETVRNAFWATCNDMHRPVVHFVVRIFCGCFPKCVFNVLNTLMAGALILLLLRSAKGRWRVQMQDVLLAIALVLLILFKGESYLWVAGSVNYLWAGSFAILFCMLRKRLVVQDIGMGESLLWAVPVFLLGWTMEAFVFPILFAIGIDALFRKLRLKPAEWILYPLYALGALVLASAEGGRVAAVSHFSLDGMLMNLLKIGVTIKAVWLLAIALVFVKDKRALVEKNRFELLIILGSILMIVVVGFNGERSLWAANLFAIVVLLKVWSLKGWQSVVLSVSLLALFPMLAMTGRQIANEFDSFLSTYLSSKDGVAGHRRVLAGPLDRFFYQESYTWCSGTHGANVANFYGHSKRPVGLPGKLYEDLYLEDRFCTPENEMAIKGFYTTKDITTIVHPLLKDANYNAKWRTQVEYGYPPGIIWKIRRSVNNSKYPHPVSTREGYVLNTSHGAYLLISKEYGSDAFIKSIVVEEKK